MKFVMIIFFLTFSLRYCGNACDIITVNQDTIIKVDRPIVELSGSTFSSKFITIINDKPYNEANTDTTKNRLAFKKVVFKESKFRGDADFQYARFINDADFTESIFFGSAKFLGTNFQKVTNFTRTTFNGSMFFNYLTLTDTAVFKFYQASLPDFMDFTRNDHVPVVIDLTRARFDSLALYQANSRRWHYINICYSDPGKIKIDYTHFRLCFFNDFFLVDTSFCLDKHANAIKVRVAGVLLDPAALAQNPSFKTYMGKVFPQTKQDTNHDSFWATLFPRFLDSKRFEEPDHIFSVFIEECISRKGFPKALDEGEIATFYNRQLKYFENEGDRESYRRLDIEYQIGTSSWIPKVWNCFGYHKGWILWWTGIFILLFTLITYCILDSLCKVYNFHHIKITHLRKELVLKRIYYSFILTVSIFFSISLKFEKLVLANFCALYFVLVYLVGVLCMGYLAAFILQR